jgi:Fe-S-cluster containining protein
MSILPIIESCEGCGACCMTQESPPGYLMILALGEDYAASDAELERFRSLPSPVMEEMKSYGARIKAGLDHPNNGVCIWFDEGTRKCRH